MAKLVLKQSVKALRPLVYFVQISSLPEAPFWSSMPSLQLLYLHDNPVGRIEHIRNLSGCPSLLAMTLYDTPVSLRRNYRHHVVNSIWSLRALDGHVISDEEIIEDARFRNDFSALQPRFRIDLCPQVSEVWLVRGYWLPTFVSLLHVLERMSFLQALECRLREESVCCNYLQNIDTFLLLSDIYVEPISVSIQMHCTWYK